MRLVAEQALIPLAQQINQYWDDASLKENGKSECEPFTRTLAYLQRRKLDQCRAELGRIALAAMEKDAAARADREKYEVCCGFTEEEFSRLSAHAAVQGMTVEEWALHLLRGLTFFPRDSE